MTTGPVRGRTAGKSLAAGAVGLAVAIGGGVLTPVVAHAAPNSDVGFPEFHGAADPVPPVPAYTPDSMMQAIFDQDVAAGAGSEPGNDFWMDRMLVRTGTAGESGDNNQWLFTRGRAVFMKTHEPAGLGFDGQVAYWEAIDNREAYTVVLRVDGQDVALTEDTDARQQTPSYWRSEHANAALGLRVVQTKFITDANVMVTNLEVRNTGTAPTVVELRATSPFASAVQDTELTGGVVALNDVTTIYPRFSGDGFVPDAGSLSRTVEVPAEGSVTTKVQLGLVTQEIPESRTDYDAYRAASPEAAYSTHVTTYNRWWAQNVPYLDTPEDNIDKTLFYRWWLLRFNYLDANMPGNAYQFPTAMEGVFGYNNAIDLTVGMFVDDLKYLRDPIYSYGGWVSTGETSKGGRFVDNPGDPANWNASHTQYISEAAWRSYQMHGGPLGIVENLARYAEGDAEGQLSSYDSNDNGLLETNWNAWTGNDADAVSFDYYGRTNERAESAYVYSGAMAAAQAYEMLGEEAKVAEMEAVAAKVQSGVIDHLWDAGENLIKHRDLSTGNLIPWKEINNYYPFSVGLVPQEGDEDYADDYVEALRLFADDEQYPIFPFTTANQADKAEAAAAGHPGSNNFSVINSTVTFRMLSSVLREYPTEYIDAQWYKKLLYWNAYAHYMNDGDNRLPDQNEFWADGDHDPQGIEYRSWIHHTILGTTNFTMIEDAMGLRPRSDAKIELYPIDVDWPHFTANNLRYRDKDLTIVWDEPGDGERPYGTDVPEGYSVFLGGTLAFTVDSLTHVVYDPATGEVAFGEDVVNATTAPEVLYSVVAELKAPQEVTFAADARVVDLFAKAGQDVSPAGAATVNLAEGAAATGTFAAPGRAASGAVDGTTINEPFWGTVGSPNAQDSLEVDLGSPRPVDDVRVYFYDTSSSQTAAGYAEPSMFTVEYLDGDSWLPVPGQTHAPVHPRANLNEVRFDEITAQHLRVTVTHADGHRTGIKELQVFSTGGEAPAAVNAAPQVTAFQDGRRDRAGQALLIGTVKDDALPTGELTSAWTVVSAPEGGWAIFEEPSQATSVVRFSAAGEYTVRLTASDGELTTSVDVVLEGSAAEGGTNVAPAATATASYTAGWNDVEAVSNGVGVNSGGANTEVWGTWTGNEPATRWLQYTWDTPVRIDGSEIMFWTDAAAGSGGGVAVPDSWVMEYRDLATGEWVEVPSPSECGTARTGTNTTTFEMVTTTALRATFAASPNGAGTSYSALGVSEWEVFAVAPESVEPVHVRTLVDQAPAMPDEVVAVYADGSSLSSSVAWAPITAEQLATEGDITVVGIVEGTSILAQATVWVRTETTVVVNVVDPVTASTVTGTAPTLPDSVTVLYNDGSRQSGIGVTWDAVDPQEYAAAGEFTVGGDVEGTEIRAQATVTVTGPGGGTDTSAPTVELSTSPEAPASGWFTGEVAVSVAATDDVDPDPVVEVSLDGGGWTAYSGPVAVDEDGAHTVAARATDEAGNLSEEVEVAVKVDTTAPALVATVDDEARSVTLSATDDGSGVALVEVRVDDGDWTGYTAPVAVGDEAVTVHFRSADVAGNVSVEDHVELGPVEPEPAPEFVDVVEGQVFFAEIRWMAEAGLSRGTVIGDETFFLPASPVSRQAMAAFVYRYMEADFAPEAGTQSFTDVSPQHPLYTEIEWMKAQGLASGYADGSFGTTRPVSRQAMAAFLHRLAGEPDAASASSFSDVTAGNQFAGAIAWLAEEEITDGYPDGTFGITKPVTRQAMAAFLFRYDELG